MLRFECKVTTFLGDMQENDNLLSDFYWTGGGRNTISTHSCVNL